MNTQPPVKFDPKHDKAPSEMGPLADLNLRVNGYLVQEWNDGRVTIDGKRSRFDYFETIRRVRLVTALGEDR
jgi:hypothetical protein